MRLLVVLNESVPGEHVDVHWALSRLMETGTLEAYRVFPFLSRQMEGLNQKEVLREIVQVAKEMLPNGVLWAHTSGLAVTRGAIESLRSLPSLPSLGYWDADLYQSPYKPIPRDVTALACMCDVSFWPGYNRTIATLRESGCNDIRFVPCPTDPLRFGTKRSEEPEFDVVMVGNQVTSRIPWRTFPGSRWRKEVADFFYERLGSRFAVFGNGWYGPYARGPVEFASQGRIYHKSRIALGINNLHGSYYFSNRLPISFSSGVTIVHNYEIGYEGIFKSIDYPYFFQTTEEAWAVAKTLLTMRTSEIREIESRIHEYSTRSLSILNCFEYMSNSMTELRSHIHKLGVEKSVTNPWIQKALI